MSGRLSDHRQLRKIAEALGYEYALSRANHIRYRHRSTGATVTVALTPSDHRWKQNATSQLKRGARGVLSPAARR
jgi:predicted RNA binding protein YcfA (HicA-like mRNA interferase family)